MNKRHWLILIGTAALALTLGVVNSFDVPGRQALYVHLVEPDDLGNAISLNSATCWPAADAKRWSGAKNASVRPSSRR